MPDDNKDNKKNGWHQQKRSPKMWDMNLIRQNQRDWEISLRESVTLKRKCDRNMKEQHANRLYSCLSYSMAVNVKPFTHRWTRNSKQQRCRSTDECWEYCEVNMWTVR